MIIHRLTDRQSETECIRWITVGTGAKNHLLKIMWYTRRNCRFIVNDVANDQTPPVGRIGMLVIGLRFGLVLTVSHDRRTSKNISVDVWHSR